MGKRKKNRKIILIRSIIKDAKFFFCLNQKNRFIANSFSATKRKISLPGLLE